MRQINYYGLGIIKRFEGLEDGDPTTLNLDPYVCPAGVWTIGWGHAIFYNGQLLRALPGKIYEETKEIAKSLYPNGLTVEQAGELLKADMVKYALQVENATIGITLNDSQFSALVSFVFNVGIGNFKSSTLLKKLKGGDYLGAAEEFPKWRRSNGKILRGLVLRRAAERDLFLKN